MEIAIAANLNPLDKELRSIQKELWHRAKEKRLALHDSLWSAPIRRPIHNQTIILFLLELQHSGLRNGNFLGNPFLKNEAHL